MTTRNTSCHPNSDRLLESRNLSTVLTELPAASFFKTYDCRGKYGVEATEEACFRLGLAASAYKRPIVLGMDYRLHNDSLASAFMQGFSGSVRFAGHVPSPVLAYSCKTGWGVSFTASHNPAGYNGVKFKKHQRCFFENELLQLKQWFGASNKHFFFENKPLPTVDENVKKNYIQSLPEIQAGLFDLAGGAACALSEIFPSVLFETPDPSFSKHAPEPKEGTLDVLAQKTKVEHKVGFAFDGDADRCVVVDNGVVVDGGILAAYLASRFPKGSKVFVTLDTQAEVFSFLQDAGFSVGYTPVGDVFIVKALLEQSADLAAERSGHFSFRKHMPDSDGVYTAAFLSDARPGEILEFSQQFKNVSLKDEVHYCVDFVKLKSLVEDKALRVDDLDGVKAEFDDFTFMARASKTEQKVRINVEAQTAQKAKEGLDVVLGWLDLSRRGR